MGCAPDFRYSHIIPRIVEKFFSVKYTSNHNQASIVFVGPFLNINSYKSQKSKLIQKINEVVFNAKKFSLANPYITLRNSIDPFNQKIFIYLSGESPVYSNFSLFETTSCDFGFTQQNIQSHNHIRLANWLHSLDWTDQGLDTSIINTPRLGKPISRNELLSPINYNTKGDPSCILITSHLKSPRASLYELVNLSAPITIVGMKGKGKPQNRAGESKRSLSAGYALTLCPENTLYPGYITEKIPESFACGTLPISYYLNDNPDKFSTKSHINLIDILNSSDSANMLKSHIQLYSQIYTEPLLYSWPSLNPYIVFLEKIISNL